jgi:hypothetical protein
VPKPGGGRGDDAGKPDPELEQFVSQWVPADAQGPHQAMGREHGNPRIPPCGTTEVGPLEAWIEEGWLAPDRNGGGERFSEVDVARAQLIRELGNSA